MRTDTITAPAARRPDGLLVVTVDRLPAWMLPAYGATWVATPSIDSLAARGIVFDRVITPATDPGETLGDLVGTCDPDGWSLARAVAARHWQPALVTDDPAAAAWFAAHVGAEVTLVAATAKGREEAEDGETNLARLSAAAVDVIRSGRHRMVWCHVASLGVAWDAPRRYRDRYVDPEDPPPQAGAGVPSFAVEAGTDPDMIVGVRQVFAGQLSLFDAEIGRLFAAARAGEQGAGDADWTVLFAGVRGLPLGLHGWVGIGGTDTPHGELIHVPAIVVDSAGRMAAQRYGGLVVPADLGSTLAGLVAGGGLRRTETDPAAPWLGVSLADLFENWSASVRDRVVVGGAEAAIVTSSWHALLRRIGPDAKAGVGVRLFAKPDDFFELTDVADRCTAVVEQLADVLTRAAAGERLTPWNAPLPDATPD